MVKRLVLVLSILLATTNINAATWLTQAALVSNAEFLGRVKLASVSAAISIVNEDPQTPDHVNRAALAGRVVHQPDKYALVLVVGVAADMTISTTSTDAELNTRIASIWTAYAISGF